MSHQVVRELVALGTQIHIDDFGTGWSSFQQLRRFAFHGLKIDQSFVNLLGHDPTTDVIVAGILSIARTLGLHVIAEGVERDDQNAALTSLGCDAAQGYLWSRPVDPDQIVALLRRSTRDRLDALATDVPHTRPAGQRPASAGT